MERIGRRGVLGAAGAGLIAVSVGGAARYLTPGEARAAGLAFRRFSAPEAACLEAMAEIMLVGAAAAGVVHYVDDQLDRDPADSLLFARYLDLDGPIPDFYHQGLAAMDGVAKVVGGSTFAALPKLQATSLVRSLFGGSPAGWQGPPAALFYTAIRIDAIDMVYGGPDGMERLGIPVMQHAPAPRKW
jgi:hypothetical protein